MDIELADDNNGIEGVKTLKAHFPHIKVMMQTIYGDNDRIFQAIKAGAEGYLLKNAPPEDLLTAMWDVCQGGAPMTPSIAFKVLEMFRNPPSITQETPTEIMQLSERQKEVLECLVNGMTYGKIAEKLFISIDTVRFHVTKIYDLLHVSSKYELIAKYKK
jgi:DNA-binding NarL/FixJ family response regulator